MKVTGRRSRAWPIDPSAALGGLEHLLSRLHGLDVGARTRTLEALLDHVLSRRLTIAEHARARLETELAASDAEDATLRAYAGFVDPAILLCRGLDSTPLSASELVQLLAEPEAFFLRRMLGAWRAPRLRDGWDPIARWWVEKTLVAETRTVLERREDADRRLREAFESRTVEELERTGVGDADAQSRLGRMADRAISALLGTNPAPGPIHELEAAPLADDLPWRLRGGDARVIGAGLHWIVTETPGERSLHKAVAPLLETIARGGPRRFPVLTFHDVRGDRAEFDQKVPDAVASTLSTLRLATSSVRAGFFPAALPEPASLAVWGIVDSAGGDA
jgi:hypothetical protein